MNIIKENIKDILDSKGKNKNFLTNEKYTPEYLELAKVWSKFPIYSDAKKLLEFFELVDKNQVVLVVSGTGSGKTVICPKLLLKYFMSNKVEGKIAITNPKILPTVKNAEFSAKCLDVKLGHEVGYAYANAPDESSSEFTKLLYCTDGLLASTILGGDKYLSKYSGVIIDEAHERVINIDILLSLLKEVLFERPEFKLIIMSATIDSKVFKDYYVKDKIKYGELYVSGEPNFPIAHNWLDKDVRVSEWNYVDKAFDICINIMESSDSGDIIVFVPAVTDAIKGCRLLKEQCSNKMKIKKETCSSTYCIEVYGKMDDEMKDLATSKDLYKVEGYKRKVIFATNVAESSMTFDGLVYVIDTGLELHSFYNYEINASSIVKQHTTQAQIKQRIGRTGRTANGIAYHLYTEKDYNNFKQYPDTAILLNDLTDIFLQVINYARTLSNVINIFKNLITPPHVKQFINTLYKLYFIDAVKIIAGESTKVDINDINYDTIKNWSNLDQYNGAITSVGYNLLKFRNIYTPILSAYAIIISHYMECSREMIIIMGILDETNAQIKNLFKYQQQEEMNVINYFQPAIVQMSDHLTILNIYNDFYLAGKTKYLQLEVFEKIKNRIDSIIDICNTIDDEKFTAMKEKYIRISIPPFKNLNDNIIYSLGLSHYFNLIRKIDDNYESQHYLLNSVAKGEFCKLIKKASGTEYAREYAICSGLSDAFGKKSFKCITHISKEIMTIISGVES